MKNGMEASFNNRSFESGGDSARPADKEAADEASEAKAGVTAQDPETKKPSIDQSTLRERLQGLVDRASAGDATAVPALRQALHEHPELFDGAGNLSQLAEAAWLSQVVGTNLFRKVATETELQAMRRDLLGPNPTRAERLLAEQVSICWLQARYVEIQFLANHDSSEQIRNELTKRQESAQRRLANSIKHLTQLQRALRPHARPKDAPRAVDPLAAFQDRNNDGCGVLRIAPETEGHDNGLDVAG